MERANTDYMVRGPVAPVVVHPGCASDWGDCRGDTPLAVLHVAPAVGEPLDSGPRVAPGVWAFVAPKTGRKIAVHQQD